VDRLTEAHAAVLDAVSDAAVGLWELPWGSKSWSGDKLVRQVGSVSVEEARLALLELVAADAVAIYEERNEESRQLRDDETEPTILDDANWKPPAESGRTAWYSAALTESGESVYQRAAETFGWG
jgi:hypothetical protein